MKVLALDLSTKTGFALFDGDQLIEKGLIRVEVKAFNVNDHPEKQKYYPGNILDAAHHVGFMVSELYFRVRPDHIVIENTVRGRNRHTQRLLEFIHKSVLDELRSIKAPFSYMDPSEWRFVLGLRLSIPDKQKNKLVNAGKVRGKVTRKHLSVRLANEMYGLNLKLKDNDIADAICLGKAFLTKGLGS